MERCATDCEKAAACACAGLHVVLAALTHHLQFIYLPVALVVLLLAAIAGARSLVRLAPA